ncbi:MAG: hypothetical protein H7836_09125, partial [Magnetococcus sp. YQC-3]
MDDKWTAKTVFARMEEAVLTLRGLRMAGLKPAGYVSSWPIKNGIDIALAIVIPFATETDPLYNN